MSNPERNNPEAYAAVLGLVRAAWALVDNTGYHDWLPLAVNRDDWNELATRLNALKALIPAEELPAEPPHAVVCCWPAASSSRPEPSEVTELQISYLCSALAGTIDEKATLALRVRELEAENARLRHVAQSRYELLRECQSELRAHFNGGMVETIEAALAQK